MRRGRPKHAPPPRRFTTHTQGLPKAEQRPGGRLAGDLLTIHKGAGRARRPLLTRGRGRRDFRCGLRWAVFGCQIGVEMSYIPGQPVTAVVQRVEIHKLRQGENLILGFSIGGGIDQDPSQNPFSEDKTDKGIYVTRVSEGGPAEIAGLQIGDKIMQVNGWDMTMVTHDQARKRLTKRSEEVVRLLVTRQSLQKAVQQSMLS
nr:Tax1 binding protein 3 [Molossus molossus]